MSEQRKFWIAVAAANHVAKGRVGGFMPFRRDVAWYDAKPTAIAPMLDTLSFTKGKTSWGYQFRFGIFDIPEPDMLMIARNMGIGDLELPANWP
jgi:hypothetical protein